MVHVEQRPLRTLEQHALPLADGMVHHQPGVGRHLEEARRVLLLAGAEGG